MIYFVFRQLINKWMNMLLCYSLEQSVTRKKKETYETTQ